MMQKNLKTFLLGGLILFGGLSSCRASEQDFIKIADQVFTKITQALPAEITPPVTVVPQSKSSSAFTSLEESVHQQINQYRKSKKLPPLKLDVAITQQARKHSTAMAKGQVPFSHDGFENRVKAIAKSLPYRSAAENVAYNQGYSKPDQQAVDGWIKSPGHRHNMEGNFDLTGIGVSKNALGEYYLTQIFIKRR